MRRRTRRPRASARLRSERGFSITELLAASAVSLSVLGLAAQMVSGVERGYTRQLDVALYREEARYAVDWIVQSLRAAGSNPYGVAVSSCPAANTAFLPLRLDPNQNGVDDDIRLNADAGVPNGLLGGEAGACTEPGEDVTIAFDPAGRTITQQDQNLDAVPIPMTDSVITALQFTYLDEDRVATADPDAVAFVGVAVTAQSNVKNAQTGLFDTITLGSEVRVRSR